MRRIYLVDVSSLIFRAFYAVRPLTSPSGLPVNAIYGFMSMILKLMKEEKPAAMVFCYDRKEPSFRKDVYDDYKANRSAMPEDLVPQMPYFRRLGEIMGIPGLDVASYEADDIIGTLTKWGRRHDYEVLIVSGDKDFAQLVEPHVWLYDTMKNTRMGTDQVIEKWGIRPDQMVDYLALVGDASDNIPGVKGLGPKGAQKLLEQFGTLDGIYKNIDEVKGSTHDKLVTSKDNAFLSRQLVTIVTDVPVPVDPHQYDLQAVDQEQMKALLSELNFKGFDRSLAELPNWGGAVTAAAGERPTLESQRKPKPTAPAPPASMPLMASESAGDHLAIEVSELSQHFQKKSVAYTFKHEMGFVFSKGPGDPVFLVPTDTAALTKVLNHLDLDFKGFDLKTFWHFFDLENPRAAWDGMLAAYVTQAGDVSSWELVFARFCGEPPKTLPTPTEKMLELFRLEAKSNEDLASNRKVYQEQDLPLTAILYKMEQRGIALDSKILAGQSQELTKEISRLEKEIHAAAHEEFNIGSPKQLAVILFDKLKLTPGRKTKTGYSTDAEVLDGLKTEHAIIPLILTYRELTKLKSTYVDALPLMVKADGRIHTTFNQAMTTTGRLSSIDPNLQNIPIRTERGARVRKAFIAGPGLSLLSVDYSQVELRILAHYSDDPNLIKAFKDDLDIHAATASEVFGVALKEVTSDQRRAAKAVNFGIAYGQGAFGLAGALGIPMSEAKGIIDRYFAKFPGVGTYITHTIESAKEKGFVETLTGRKRYMPELQSGNGAMRKFGERAAINAPIQGTAADLVKLAMVELDQKFKSKMLLQVHDELIFEAPKEVLESEAPAIVSVMENIMRFKVPIKANWAIGSNWDEAH
ncbi:MAG: DNA polymerase I [Bdellovibrio sp.]